MKYYTTVEQSKKLVELGIDVDSADMSYRYTYCLLIDGEPKEDWLLEPYKPFDECGEEQLPCWSTEALLKLLPRNINHLFVLDDIFVFPANGYRLSYRNVRKYTDDKIIVTYSNDTLLNCAYNMIVKLKELKLL